jgi:hypothetical protein
MKKLIIAMIAGMFVMSAAFANEHEGTPAPEHKDAAAPAKKATKKAKKHGKKAADHQETEAQH